MRDCWCTPRCLGRSSTRGENDGPARRNPNVAPAQVSLADLKPASAQITEGTSSRMQQRPHMAQDSVKSSRALLRGPAELDQLVVEDSDNEDDDSQLSKRDGGTLDAVRSRLLRQFSHESNMRRRSRMSVGHSQEEIARRAELRRLRHKRIQDELQIGDANDASSKNSTPSTRYLPHLHDLIHTRGGPRDNIEFSVLGGQHESDPGSSAPSRSDSGNPMPEQPDASHRRRNSCPQSSMDDQRKCTSKVAYGDRISLPGMNDPNITPIPPTSSGQESVPRKPDHSSSSSSLMDEAVGVETSYQCEPHSWDEQSALGVWLVAQGMRSRESSTMRLGAADASIVTAQEEPQPQAEKPQETHRVPEAPSTNVHDFISPFERWKRWTSGCHAEENYSDDVSDDVPTDENAMVSRRVSDSIDEIINSHLPIQEPVKADEPPPVDNNSSNYPSVLPSFQPSPLRSQANLHSLSFTDLENLELSPFKWNENPSKLRNLRLSEGCSSYVTAENEHASSDDDQRSMHNPPHPLRASYACAASTLALSETASFRQRESELGTLEKRFGNALSRTKLPSNITSRFKEEFGHTGPAGIGKQSLISKIHLSVPRISKSTSSKAIHRSGSGLDVPEYPVSNPSTAKSTGSSRNSLRRFGKRSRNLTSSSHLDRQPELERSATDLWQRAIMLEAQERRRSLNGSKLHASDQLRAPSSKRSLNFMKGKWRGRSRQSSLSSFDTMPETSRLTPQADELPSSEEQSNLSTLIRRWETEMLQNQSNKRPPKDPPPKKLTKPPQSWARFPSHTREKRTAHASFADHVKSKDFALKGHYSEGQLQWTTDRSGGTSGGELSESGSRVLAGRFGKVVKSGLSKMFPTRSGLPEDSSNALSGRRSSSRAGGQLEYPELEILPTEGGYRELNALEAEINNMKGRLSTSSRNEDKSISNRILGSRVSAMMQDKGANEDHADKPSLIGVIRSPITPSPPPASRNIPSDRGTTPEEFVTPLSRLTFGDTTAQENASVDIESDASRGYTLLRKTRSISQPLTMGNLEEVDAKLQRFQNPQRRIISPVLFAPLNTSAHGNADSCYDRLSASTASH